MCEACNRREERDAKLWRTIRRALIMMAAGIAERYPDESKKRVA